MTNQKATFVISIDLELAWGIWDRINSAYLYNAVNLERNIINQLLEIFKNFDLPVTWATVAALIDENNKMISIGDKKAWYAPEIIEKIINSKPKHLIASHSYAHPNFKENNKNFIINDFEKSEFFFKTFGIKPNVLIFPRNQINHLDILKNFNYKFFRGQDFSWYKKVANLNKFFGRMANLADKIFPFKTNSIKPINHKCGLIEIPSSLLLISRDGFKFPVSNLNMYYKIKCGIELAIKNKECFHLWFHPSNFYFKSHKQFILLNDILTFVTSKRDRGLLDVKLMDQF